jgi:predicted dehydrogenase
MQRRDFLVAAGASALAAQAPAQEKKVSANDKIAVCVMGVRGRGAALLSAFAAQQDVEVRYVCDIDENVLGQRVEATQKQGQKPKAIKDYREALDDKSLDAIVNGGPDHWHALPTIHACQAKKDVYVEKPDGHNIVEGRTMVAAMKKYERVVQMGTQMRSAKHMLAAVEYLKTGVLGKVRFAKAWESGKQGAITAVADSDPPKGVDYDRWLGPAPLRPFNARRFHGNWRWFFDYGTGDLGNDGVHRLDIARWALEAALEGAKQELPKVPARISALGGKYYFDDVQEWPDTLQVTYDYDGLAVLTYEMRIWTAYPLFDEPEGALVYGDNGYLVMGNSRWRAFDAKGKLVKEESGQYDDGTHVRNFLDCMRSRKAPNADLATVGHYSSLLCHLGNAAWRTRRTLRFDTDEYQFLDDADANKLLTRAEYRKPYVLPALDAL